MKNIYFQRYNKLKNYQLLLFGVKSRLQESEDKCWYTELAYNTSISETCQVQGKHHTPPIYSHIS